MRLSVYLAIKTNQNGNFLFSSGSRKILEDRLIEETCLLRYYIDNGDLELKMEVRFYYNLSNSMRETESGKYFKPCPQKKQIKFTVV